MRLVSLSLVVVLALTGCAGSPYYVSPGAKAFLPARGNPPMLGEMAVVPDGVVLETPVGFRNAARLKAPIQVSMVGKDLGFPAGEVLSVAGISGISRNLIPPEAPVFCGMANEGIAKTLLAGTTLGISTLFNRTGLHNRLCLFDSDSDGALDKAVLAGVKKEKDATPVAFDPVPYERAVNEVMQGESHARIVYKGKTGLVGGHISFDLQVVEQGVPLFFNNVRTEVKINELPKQVELMGAVFTVKSYDRDTGKVTVDVARGFPETSYGITTTYTTRTIPIYIPR